MYQFSLSVSEKYVQNYCSCQSFNSYNPTSSFDILNYMKSYNSAINTRSTTKSKLKHTLIPLSSQFYSQLFFTLMEWSSCHRRKCFCFSHYEPVKIYFWLQFIISVLNIYFVLLLNVYPLALTSYNNWLVIFNQ